jgi:hypothetical protein
VQAELTVFQTQVGKLALEISQLSYAFLAAQVVGKSIHPVTAPFTGFAETHAVNAVLQAVVVVNVLSTVVHPESIH